MIEHQHRESNGYRYLPIGYEWRSSYKTTIHRTRSASTLNLSNEGIKLLQIHPDDKRYEVIKKTYPLQSHYASMFKGRYHYMDMNDLMACAQLAVLKCMTSYKSGKYGQFGFLKMCRVSIFRGVERYCDKWHKHQIMDANYMGQPQSDTYQPDP